MKSILSHINRLTILVLLLVVVIIVLIWKLNNQQLEEEVLIDVVDYVPKPIETGNLKQYRVSANYIESDFNPENGKNLFYEKCAACHRLNENVIVGPGFQGLFARIPNKSWLFQFLTNPDSLRLENNEYTISLDSSYFGRADKKYHTNEYFYEKYSRQEIVDVIGFIGMIE